MIRLLRVLLSNVALLLLSLAAAFAIWTVAVQQSDRTQRVLFQVPVEVLGLPSDSQIIDNPDFVEVRVEGPTSIVEQLATEDFMAQIDVSDLPAGTHLLEVQVLEEIDRVEIVDQSPTVAEITIERIITKEIPVLVDVRGDVAQGYETGTVFADPESIQVTGPASRVDPLAEARVDVFLDFPREDTVRVRTPTFYSRQGEIVSVAGLTLSVREVQVTVPVDERAGFGLKSVVVDFIGVPAPGYRVLSVSAEPNSVLISGRPTQIEQVSTVRTEEIDVTGLRESITVAAALDLPEGVELEDVQSVVVTIEIEPIITTDVVRKPPEIRNLGEGLTATLEVEEIVVFLAGPFDKLEALADDDVRVTLDLFGLITGTHSVAPEVGVLVSDVSVRSVQPPEVTVVISAVVTPTNTLTPAISFQGRPLTTAPAGTGTTPVPLAVHAPAAAAPLLPWRARDRVWL